MSDNETIVSLYRAGSPTIVNSRELVSQIAREHHVAEAQVRRILQHAGVYIPKASNPRSVQPEHETAILNEFRKFVGTSDDHDIYQKRQSFLHVISQSTGYGKWALDDLDDRTRLIPVSAHHQATRDYFDQRASEEQALKYEEEKTQEIVSKTSSNSRSGPDGCGWIFIIGISLLLVTCISNYNPDEGKSVLQKNSEALCASMGGCR